LHGAALLKKRKPRWNTLTCVTMLGGGEVDRTRGTGDPQALCLDPPDIPQSIEAPLGLSRSGLSVDRHVVTTRGTDSPADPDLFSIRPRAPGPARAARRKEATSQPQLANGALKVSVWSKVLRGNAAREDRDEILDVIYWSRQIIAVGLGVIRGELPLRGFLGRAGLCLTSAGVLNYLQIDEEEYGFMTSFALFMVIWITFYTAIHYDCWCTVPTCALSGPKDPPSYTTET
ncbi:hypothetical protein EI555_006035, partial [Monodon monoceros]